MKVVTDFLPTEYKSFVLNVRALGVLVVFALGTAAVCFLNHKDFKDQLVGLEGQIKRENEEIGILVNKINSKSYNQQEIRELIDKFNFIKEAVGARDFPWLRFYHSLERTIPIDETDGTRRVAIKVLSGGRGNQWRLQGIAKHWDDLLRFEKNLNESTFVDPDRGEVKNFGGVKMGGWVKTDAGVDFSADFEFRP